MIQQLITKMIHFIAKHYRLTLLIVLILTMGMVYITKERFEINASLTALLPEHQESVLNLKELKKRKGSTDNMIIVLESHYLDHSKEFAKKISDALKNDPLISEIEYHRDVDFIKNRMLLRVDKSDLISIKNSIKKKVSTEKVKKVTNLGLEDDGLEDSGEDDPDETDFEGDPFKKKEPVKKNVVKESSNQKSDTQSDNMLANINDRLSKYSKSFDNRFKAWRISLDEKILVVMVTPSKPAGDIKFTRKLDKHIRTKIAAIQKKFPKYREIQVGYSGSYVTTIRESGEIKDNVISSIGLSIGLILFLLFLYFGRLRSLLMIMIPLVIGMIWTAGIFFLMEDYLNLVAAFIFAILLGLGIDFGIHILSRYRQERNNNQEPIEALVISMTQTGSAIVVGGFTTAAAFLSLIFADFQGFSQFGRLACLGVLLNLLAIYITFPALIILLERHTSGLKNAINLYKVVFQKIFKPKQNSVKKSFPLVIPIIIATLLLITGGTVFLLSKPVQFEYHFGKLGRKKTKKNMLTKKYRSATKFSLSPLVVLTDSADETEKLHRMLNERTRNRTHAVAQPAIFPSLIPHNTYLYYNHSENIRTIASIYSFFPEQQQERYKLLQEINHLLRPSRVKKLKPNEQKSIEDLRPYLTKATPFIMEQLPDFVKRLFRDREGNFQKILYLYADKNISDGHNSMALTKEIRALRINGKKVRATGQPMIFSDILTLMLNDGVTISFLALIFIFFILIIFTRSLLKTLLLLFPLGLGLLLTFVLMSLFNLKLNFYNMVVIPSLIGMGIDNAIHIFHRLEEDHFTDIRHSFKKIFGSVTMATITTMIGFSGLLTANHNGLNSIGYLAILGMLSMWLTVVLPLPALLQLIHHKKSL